MDRDNLDGFPARMYLKPENNLSVLAESTPENSASVPMVAATIGIKPEIFGARYRDQWVRSYPEIALRHHGELTD